MNIATPNNLAILLYIISTMAFVITIVAWRRRSVETSGYFFLLMLSISLYTLFSALENSFPAIGYKIIFAKLSFIGIVHIAPCWLLFSLAYLKPKNRIRRSLIAGIWIFPTVVVGLAVTNNWHHWIWNSFSLSSQEPRFWLVINPAIGFWILLGCAYLTMLVGSYQLIHSANRSPHLLRWQSILIVLASLLPWIGNFFLIANNEPWHRSVLTPLTFVLSGLFLAESLYQFHLFKVVPVARDVVFNSIEAGVLVLDNLNRLVDINPKAREWTGLKDDSIGHKLIDLLGLEDLIQQYEDTVEGQSVIPIGEGEDLRIYQLKISPIRNPQGGLQGRVILLNDISQEQALLKSAQFQTRRVELLNSITKGVLSKSELPTLLQTMTEQLGELFEADGAFLTLWDQEQQRVIPQAAYGNFSEGYSGIKIEPGEKTLTESVLLAGHVLVVEDVLNSPYISPRIANLLPSRSTLVIPLIANGKKLGAAIVSFQQAHLFSSEEKALGEQVAGQISLAIDKGLMYAAEHHRNSQLTALQSSSRKIASYLDFEKIFETIVEELHLTFGYAYVSIYILTEGRLQLKAQVGFHDEPSLNEIPIARGVMGRAVRFRQPQYIRDVSLDPDFLGDKNEIGSEICVPLLRNQTVVGVINIESPRSHLLVEADIQLLITFASQVVVAIDNASLFKAEQEQRKLAEALREMGMALSERLDLDSVFSQLLEEIQHVIPYDQARVMFVGEDHNQAELTYIRVGKQPIQSSQKADPFELEISNTPYMHQMISTGKPLVIGDTAAKSVGTTHPFLADFQSFLGVPVIFHHEVICFLFLDKKEAWFYQPEHGKILSSFSSQAAIAIQNARSFTEIQNRMEREKMLLAAIHDFTAGLETEEALKAFMRHVVKILKVDGCTISRWDPGNDCVVTQLDFDTDPDVAPVQVGSSYSLIDYPLTRSVIENQQPIMINLEDGAGDSDECALMVEYGNQALLMLPLVVGREKKVYGVVELFRKMVGNPFTSNDLELAESFLAQIAIAFENANLYSEAQHQAIVDELTGLYNRRGFLELGKRELERCIRFNHPIVALFLDIDHFKLFNDNYSYAIGDQVLREFSDCLRSNLREFDLIGRYGGEEFVVLLPETDLQGAREVAERLRSSVAALKIQTNRGDTGITVSIGVCNRTPELQNLEAFINQAGQALHMAKKRRLNRVAIIE